MGAANFQAVILDLDGVITQTAQLHAKAWKQLFDEYLQQRSKREGSSYESFDIVKDYKNYVDGKPRYDGVRDFLLSRSITLPEGEPGDEPTEETICGLGNRKNELFHDLMTKEGVKVYDDTVAQIDHWRIEGLKLAVISSSKNCVPILKTAKLLDRFDAKVDGVDSVELGLNGKPAPDIFVEAARQLDVPCEYAVIIEDSIAGVKAGRNGKFGLVVGVARGEDAERLREHGAHVVVHDLSELGLADQAFRERPPPVSKTPASALDHQEAFANRLRQHRLGLFLDYDGTLTPIVASPEKAQLSEKMRSLLNELSQHCTVAIISGRDLADVQNMVHLEHLIYAGSHGFDIAGPGGLRQQQDEAQACLPQLDRAEEELRQKLADRSGVVVERKRFVVAIHYRQASEEDVNTIQETVTETRQKYERLRQSSGKKICELQPDVEWDKGKAVLWLLDTLDLYARNAVPIYIGDDVTDEDAFTALKEFGIGILVGDVSKHSTQAKYFLRNTEEVARFLKTLLSLISKHDSHG